MNYRGQNDVKLYNAEAFLYLHYRGGGNDVKFYNAEAFLHLNYRGGNYVKPNNAEAFLHPFFFKLDLLHEVLDKQVIAY